ncbi:UNVERIFIED_CONTAM: hypothetical protein Sradi_4280900 [Sesamum radiatum]|uniref:Uncharacterized protein n=1 Tax=Sesamum radiatum TaxID=300843 RepID=A0AAW2NPU2_SESRA
MCLMGFVCTAEVVCEDLPQNLCTFAIAASRCVLENYKSEEGSVDYTCKTSEVVVERLAGYIETDECVNACGVDRNSFFFLVIAFYYSSTEYALLAPADWNLYFYNKMQEYFCQHCEKHKTSPHRAMLELLSSSGGAAAAPLLDLRLLLLLPLRFNPSQKVKCGVLGL